MQRHLLVLRRVSFLRQLLGDIEDGILAVQGQTEMLDDCLDAYPSSPKSMAAGDHAGSQVPQWSEMPMYVDVPQMSIYVDT